jgi:cobalt-zinc-cadmium efflux system membrane fusion protein
MTPGQGLKVRMPSGSSARGAGAQTRAAEVGLIAEAVESYAELTFDQNKVAQIVAPVGGIVEEVAVDLGSRVAPEQVVARLWSAGIAEAVAKAVLSHQTLEREQRLREQRVTSEQDLQEAEAVHRAACQHLRTLGFSEAQIHELAERPDESVLLDVRAPFAGEIIERAAVRGELVESGHHLFTLGDRSLMWAMLNIPESDLGRVRRGQMVELQFDALPGRTFNGELTWISAQVDERTRMVRARAEVPNPEGILRARMFARARILTRPPGEALILPASALQQVEGKALVFVKLEEDLFEARRVAVGSRLDARVEILAGLNPGELVVVDHVFPIKSQFLISRLGAGCAHE